MTAASRLDFPCVRGADDAYICQQFELEPQPQLLASLTLLREQWESIGRGCEPRVPPPTTSTSRDALALTGPSQISNLVQPTGTAGYHGPDWHPYLDVRPVPPMFEGPGSMSSVPGDKSMSVLEPGECIHVRVD